MDLSSTLCRIQEGHQRERAANAGLENVRVVAEKAAAAWGLQAVAAERREARRDRARIASDLTDAEQKLGIDEDTSDDEVASGAI